MTFGAVVTHYMEATMNFCTMQDKPNNANLTIWHHMSSDSE